MLTVVVPSVEGRRRNGRIGSGNSWCRERVHIENRIAALSPPRAFGRGPSLRSWDADMRALRTGDGRPLPTHLVAELNRFCAGGFVADPRNDPRTRRGSRAGSAKATRPASRTVGALCTIRGIGGNFASVPTRVFYRTFDNRRQIASYLGLAPTPFSERRHGSRSAHQSRRQQPSPQNAGPTRLALASLVSQRAAMRHGFRDRVGSLQGRIRRITLVALARKLLIAIWRFVTLGLCTGGAIIAA